MRSRDMTRTRRKGRRAGLAAALLGAVAACASNDMETIIVDAGSILRFAAIIDGTGEKLDATEIYVNGRAIRAIGHDLIRDYPHAEVIDKSDLTALPGLIDAHVHVTYALAGPPQGDAWAELGATSREERLAGAIDNARKMLHAGVTSARDMTAFDGVDFELRELIETNQAEGPRLYLSGVGLHPITLPEGWDAVGANLPAMFAGIARERVAQGADWIKIFATSGTADDLTGEQFFGYDEIAAVVEVAHAAGVRVGVHAYGPAATPDAIRAGVDAIDHPVGLDDALLAQWAATDIIYVPTIDHNRYYAERREEFGYSAETAAELMAFVEANVETAARAHQAGVTIAMGSDALLTGFGENARELEWLVAAGLTPAEAIRAATENGAKLLGEEGRLGCLRPGCAPDIIAVEGDPLTDIKAVSRNVRWVMKASRIVK
ncbi:MAG: amidohydrolase family protein [Parvularculaceae bacterium]